MKLRKKTMQILSFSLITGLILTSCSLNPQGKNNSSSPSSPKNNSSTPTGAFVQTIVSPKDTTNDFYSPITIRPDGKFQTTGFQQGYTAAVNYTSTDGTDWQAEKGDNTPIMDLCNQLVANNMIQIYPLQDGSWWLATRGYNYPEGMESEFVTTSVETTTNLPPLENQPFTLYRMPAGGSVEKVTTPSLEEFTNEKENPTPFYMEQLSNGNLFLGIYDHMTFENLHYLVLDSTTGEELCRITLNLQNYTAFNTTIKGETLYVPNREGDMVHQYSLKTGTEEASFTIPKLNLEEDNILFDITANGDFCYIDRQGIHQVSPNGTLVQNIVEGTSFVFSSPDFYPSSFHVLEDGSYLLVADNDAGSNIYHFTFDENATSNPTDALKVWALKDSHLLRASIASYTKTFPDQPVVVEYGLSGQDSSATVTDSIHQLNVRLLNDEAPDIVILDGLPVESYISQGMLTDLSGKIDTTGCYSNLMEAYTRDGKTYAYPTQFQMPLFMAKAGDPMEEGVVSLAQLAEIAKQPGSLHYGSYLEMFETLYASYSPCIFPNANSVEEDALKEFFTQTAQISQSLSLTAENTYQHGGVGSSGVYPRQSLHAYMEQSYTYGADILWDPVSISVLYMYNGQAFSPLPGSAFIPVCAGAVPIAATHPEQAIDFIQLMLTEDSVQSLGMDEGFSVRIGQHIPYYERTEEDGMPSPADYDWDGLIAKFDKPSITEAVLQQKLYEQAEKVYKGEITVEAAVESTLQNTRLYFSERS